MTGRWQDEQEYRRVPGQRQNNLGKQVLHVPHAAVTSGYGVRVAAGMRGKRRGECQIVRSTPYPDGGKNGGEPGTKVRVAHPGRGVVDSRVGPRVTVAVAAEQVPQGRPSGHGVRCQPACQPYRGMERGRAAVGVGEPVGGHARPRLLNVGQRGGRDLCSIGISSLPGRSACRRGAQGVRERGEPPGQPGWQQIRTIGRGGAMHGHQQLVGPREQRRAVGLVHRIAEHLPDDSGGFSRPRAQYRGCRGDSAKSRFEPDQGLTRHLRGLTRRAVASPGEQPGDHPERHHVPAFPCPQQVQHVLTGCPGAPGCPVEDGVGQGIAGQRPQVGDSRRARRVAGPAENARGVDDRVGQAQMGRGDGAEGMVAGQHTARGRWPPGRRCGNQEPDGDLTIIGCGGQRRIDAGGGEAVPDRLPGIGRAQPVPHQMAQHTGAKVFVRPVGQHDQPLAAHPFEQRLANGERGHTRHDPHVYLVVRERRRPGPLRAGPHAEHPGRVVLAACLVEQRPQDRKRCPGRRLSHSCTRHSTTT